MTGTVWAIDAVMSPGRTETVAELSASRFSRAFAEKVGRVIANAIGKVVLIGREPARHNPTLVHHGLEKKAEWHVVTDGGQAVADLYGVWPVRRAQRIAEELASEVQHPVFLMDNSGLAKWGQHPKLKAGPTRSATRVNRRRNPSRLPVVGEVWHGLSGDRCRIVKVTPNRVTVLQLDTGHRVTSEINDFLATYKPPRTTRPNPTLWSVTATRRGRQVPTFLLNQDVQGFLSTEGAERIAHEVVGEGSSVSTVPWRTIDNPKHRFKDLTIGEVFEFASIRLYPYSGMARGPWRKTSARTYEPAEAGHRLAGHRLRVGSVNAEVDRTNPSRTAGARRGRKRKRAAYRSRKVYRAAVATHRASDAARAGALARFGSYDARRRARLLRRSNPLPAGAHLAADGWVEMTRAQWAKIHRDFKGYAEDWTDFGQLYGGGTPSVMFNDGRGLALYPVRITDAANFGRRVKKNPGRRLSVPEQHQLKIARQTLRMRPEFVRIMGGPTIEEAREIIYRLTGKYPKENPARSRSARYMRSLRRTAPRGVPGAGSRRAARAIRSGRAAKAHYHMLSTLDRGRFRRIAARGNPSIAEAAAEIVQAAGWDGFAADIRAGRMEPMHGLRVVAKHGTPAQQEIAKKAIRVLSGSGYRSGRKSNTRGEYHRSGPRAGTFWRRLGAPSYVARIQKTERAKQGMPPMVVLEIVVPGQGQLKNIPQVIGTSRIPVNEFFANHEPTRTNPLARGGHPRSQGPKFKVGDKVKLSATWLRSTGTFTGDLPFAKGVIVELAPFGGPGNALATIKWDTPGVPEKVLTPNLVKVGQLELNPRGSNTVAGAKQMHRTWMDSPRYRARVTKVKVPPRPKALAKLGDLIEIVYRSDKYGGTRYNKKGKALLYTHRTQRPHPVLAADGSGHVHIVGGRMVPTADGLVH